MAREDPQLKLRLPADLKQRISEAAEANNRSLNAEILNALEREYPPPPPVKELLRELDRLLEIAATDPFPFTWEHLLDQMKVVRERLESDPDRVRKESIYVWPTKRAMDLDD